MERSKVERIIKNLRQMRVPMMAEQVLMMMESNEISVLSVVDALERISEEELIARGNNKAKRLKKSANLSDKNARLQEIEYRPSRNINSSLINQLSTNDYIMKKRNVIILGACGCGKSYIANALGNQACEGHYSTYYCRLFEFINECIHTEVKEGTPAQLINRYAKYDLLIMDDFLIQGLKDKEVYFLFQLLDYRYGRKSTIFCSQVDPEEWHKQLGGDLKADAVLDRILSQAYQLILHGQSLRG